MALPQGSALTNALLSSSLRPRSCETSSRNSCPLTSSDPPRSCDPWSSHAARSLLLSESSAMGPQSTTEGRLTTEVRPPSSEGGPAGAADALTGTGAHEKKSRRLALAPGALFRSTAVTLWTSSQPTCAPLKAIHSLLASATWSAGRLSKICPVLARLRARARRRSSSLPPSPCRGASRVRSAPQRLGPGSRAAASSWASSGSRPRACRTTLPRYAA
mmetsp:Transcript_82599/g.215581  ORF Transcript_82599/g.215581 Transcript_82599/m.215581 type:complete len:217 (-) Transcript_82599:224-874(-)